MLASLFIGQTFAEDHGHNEHSQHSQKELTLNEGKKWEIDEVMKKNMGAIIQERKIIKALTNSKKANKDDYKKLSELIATSTQDIASNCKMEPKADHTFHAILADLLIVSEHLKGSKAPKHAMEKLDGALKTYNQFFNHPQSK